MRRLFFSLADRKHLGGLENVVFTFDGWVTRVVFELHWALETRLHASALNSERRAFDQLFWKQVVDRGGSVL